MNTPGKFVSDLESSEFCAPTFRTSTMQVPLLFVPLRCLPFGRPEGPVHSRWQRRGPGNGLFQPPAKKWAWGLLGKNGLGELGGVGLRLWAGLSLEPEDRLAGRSQLAYGQSASPRAGAPPRRLRRGGRTCTGS